MKKFIKTTLQFTLILLTLVLVPLLLAWILSYPLYFSYISVIHSSAFLIPYVFYFILSVIMAGVCVESEL